MTGPQLMNRPAERLGDAITHGRVGHKAVDDPRHDRLRNAKLIGKPLLGTVALKQRESNGSQSSGHGCRDTLYRTPASLSTSFERSELPRVAIHGPDAASRLKTTIDEWRETAGPGGSKLSYGDLAYEARRHGAPSTFDGSWLSKVLAGIRPYDMPMLAALAQALGREPNELPHYRLAGARLNLDEQAVGLDEALANLERVVTALRQRAVNTGATEVAQRARRRREPRANPGEAAK